MKDLLAASRGALYLLKRVQEQREGAHSLPWPEIDALEQALETEPKPDEVINFLAFIGRMTTRQQDNCIQDEDQADTLDEIIVTARKLVPPAALVELEQRKAARRKQIVDALRYFQNDMDMDAFEPTLTYEEISDLCTSIEKGGPF